MICTFGEIMLRISPLNKTDRLIQTNQFCIEPGGSESNVAIAISNLGGKCKFITKLPNNALSEIVLNYLNKFNVNTSDIIVEGDKLGIYYTENGIGFRNSFVIYDRDESSFSRLTSKELGWQSIMKGVKWFHFSGISPAVSESVNDTLIDCINLIKIPYSVDLNFRNKLWGWSKKSNAKISEIMGTLVCKATLISGNENDFQDCLNLNSAELEPDKKYFEIATKCFNQFHNLKYIAISLRTSVSASTNKWNGYFFVKESHIIAFKGKELIIENIVDRVGTGDSFTAGIIFGINYNYKWGFEKILNFAISLSALNHTTQGDASHFKVDEVLHMMKTNGSGVIIR